MVNVRKRGEEIREQKWAEKEEVVKRKSETIEKE